MIVMKDAGCGAKNETAVGLAKSLDLGDKDFANLANLMEEEENETILGSSEFGHEVTKAAETKQNADTSFEAMRKPVDGAVKRKERGTQKRVNWVDEKRLGPLAAAEDGSAYVERGLGLTTGGQPWVKKRIRRLSVEGLHGTRRKCRFRGGKSWRGFASDDPQRASKRRAWEEAATAGRTEEEVILEQQAIVQSIKELRARTAFKRSFAVPKETSREEGLSAHQTGHQTAQESTRAFEGVFSREGVDRMQPNGLSGTQEENAVQLGGTELGGIAGTSVAEAFRQKEGEGDTAARLEERSGRPIASTPLFSSNPFISNFMNRSQNADAKSVQDRANSSAMDKRVMSNGFAAIQLNPESGNIGSSKLDDLSEKRSLGSLPALQGGQSRPDDSNRKDTKDDSQPSGSYSGRGVPAFVWLKVPKTMEITKGG